MPRQSWCRRVPKKIHVDSRGVDKEMMAYGTKEDSGSRYERKTGEDAGFAERVDGRSLIEGLPDSVALQCLARVPLHYHQTLQRVSKDWRSALLSTDLFRIRKRAGVQEEWLYVCIYEKDMVWKSYDPVLDCWGTLPATPSCIKHLANFGTAALGGKLYVVGGGSDDVEPQTGDWHGSIATNEVWRFDPIIAKWEQRASMITSRSQFACCALDDRIIVAGGFSNTRKALAMAEMYNPVLDEWEALPELGQVHDASCSGTVFEQKVHVVHKGIPVAQFFDSTEKRWFASNREWPLGKIALASGQRYVVQHGLDYEEQIQAPFKEPLPSRPALRRMSFGVIGTGRSDLHVVSGVMGPPPNISNVVLLNDLHFCNVGSENQNWMKIVSGIHFKGSILGCAFVKL